MLLLLPGIILQLSYDTVTIRYITIKIYTVIIRYIRIKLCYSVTIRYITSTILEQELRELKTQLNGFGPS